MQRTQHGGTRGIRGRLVIGVGIAGVALAAALSGVAAPVLTTALYGPGDQDPDYGAGGIAVADFGGATSCADVAQTPDGKTALAGWKLAAGQYSFAVARITASGTLDGGFSGDGLAVTSFSGGSSSASGVAVQPDGKIIASGACSGNNGDFAVVRYLTNGNLDNSFGSKGKVTTDIGKRTTDGGRDVVIQPDGRIIVMGMTSAGIAVVRYLVNGTLDSTFDGDGKAIFSDSVVGPSYSPFQLSLQPDGKILLVGYATLGTPARDIPTLVRLLPSGAMDGSFGNGGVLRVDIAASLYGGGNADCYGVLVAPDGKILICGTSGPGFVARLNTNGTLDSTFNGSGISLESHGFDEPQAMVFQADGKIVVAGEFVTSTATSLAVWRLDADGRTDATCS